jgi:hypothetical protein
METQLKKLIAVAIFGMMTLGAGAVPGPSPSLARAVQSHIYVYEVWASDLLRTPSDFGHHQVSFEADYDQLALNKLNFHMNAWGQQLRDQNVHYNRLRSRLISRS